MINVNCLAWQELFYAESLQCGEVVQQSATTAPGADTSLPGQSEDDTNLHQPQLRDRATDHQGRRVHI